MLRLNDIMTRELVTVSPWLSLREAMELLTSRHITGAPVVFNQQVLGVVSLTDLVEFAAAIPGVPTLQREPAEPDDWENEGESVDDNTPPSPFFADMWDDSGAELVERFAESDGPEWDMLGEHTVDEAMTHRVCALEPETSVEEAADFMRTAGIHRVLVMDGERLLGMVTTRDIANAVADHRFTNRVYVFGSAASRRGDTTGRE
jgi:CBS domain-containing protein